MPLNSSDNWLKKKDRYISNNNDSGLPLVFQCLYGMLEYEPGKNGIEGQAISLKYGKCEMEWPCCCCEVELLDM